MNELKLEKSYNSETNTVSAMDAYRQKQKLYRALENAYSQDVVTGLKDAQMEVASTLRGATAKAAERAGMPELIPILAEEGQNINFLKYADARVAELTRKGATGGGSLGYLFSIPKMVALRVINSPNFKSRLAISIRKAKGRPATKGEISGLATAIEREFTNPETLPPAIREGGLGETIPGGAGRNLEQGAMPPAVDLTIDPITGLPLSQYTGAGNTTGRSTTVTPESMLPQQGARPVSYTHLTLPTICSV